MSNSKQGTMTKVIPKDFLLCSEAMVPTWAAVTPPAATQEVSEETVRWLSWRTQASECGSAPSHRLLSKHGPSWATKGASGTRAERDKAMTTPEETTYHRSIIYS